MPSRLTIAKCRLHTLRKGSRRRWTSQQSWPLRIVETRQKTRAMWKTKRGRRPRRCVLPKMQLQLSTLLRRLLQREGRRPRESVMRLLQHLAAPPSAVCAILYCRTRILRKRMSTPTIPQATNGHWTTMKSPVSLTRATPRRRLAKRSL